MSGHLYGRTPKVTTSIDSKISDALGITQNIVEEIIDPKPLVPRPEGALIEDTGRDAEIDIDAGLGPGGGAGVHRYSHTL